MTTTLFESYRQGLVALIAALGPGHPQLDLAYVYQQRLTENLARAVYGDTESLQAARAQILDRCQIDAPVVLAKKTVAEQMTAVSGMT